MRISLILAASAALILSFPACGTTEQQRLEAFRLGLEAADLISEISQNADADASSPAGADVEAGQK